MTVVAVAARVTCKLAYPTRHEAASLTNAGVVDQHAGISMLFPNLFRNRLDCSEVGEV